MAKKVFLKECYIQGTNQYDALEDDVWKNLVVPASLSLTTKDNNGIETKNIFLKDKNGFYIGKLSDEDGKDIEKYIKAGWGIQLYEVKLSYKDESKTDENKRTKVVIFIKLKE